MLFSIPPQIKPPAGRPDSTGRRSALAEWLCRPDHPLTGRVIANRLWQRARLQSSMPSRPRA